ncbi:MAG TPA: hypothetical protein VGB97_02865 [Candidatus Paceibacterota bacterium]|jgi:hypothetical protein
MTFNGPPQPSPEELAAGVETPKYWKENPQFVYPKGLFDTQYEFAKIMAERRNIPLLDAVKKYAPLLNKAIHTEGEEKTLIPGLTDENLAEAGYAEVLERRKSYDRTGLNYRDEKEGRFGCFYYRYDEATQTIAPHFFNAEAEEQFENGQDVSKGPLSKEKLELRKAELAEMFRDIKTKHPDAKYVRGKSNLYNLEAYRRLYPPTYAVGDVDYDPELWKGNTDIWGQFLGGHDKAPGEYGFKREPATAFLEKAKEVPLDRLVDAVPLPPRSAEGNIQDFYNFYGIT